jgi:hypothetical protein
VVSLEVLNSDLVVSSIQIDVLLALLWTVGTAVVNDKLVADEHKCTIVTLGTEFPATRLRDLHICIERSSHVIPLSRVVEFLGVSKMVDSTLH